MRSWLAVALVGCTSAEPATDVDALNLDPPTAAALSRLQFADVRVGDRLERGDLLMTGGGERVAVGFSRAVMVDYLGIDAELFMPELFDRQTHEEVFIEVPEKELAHLRLPRGIGSQTAQPLGTVRELGGRPQLSTDLREIDELFDRGEVREIYARRPSAHRAAAGERRLGVRPFPRIGPRNGVVIEAVVPDSAAARSGLSTGDRILTVQGREVFDFWSLRQAVADSRGDVLTITVKRAKNRREETLSVVF